MTASMECLKRSCEIRIIRVLAGNIAGRRSQQGAPGWTRRRRPAEIVAFHEAAHAVIGKICGSDVHEIAIVPPQSGYGYGGYCSYTPVDEKPDILKLPTDIQTAAQLSFQLALAAGAETNWRSALHQYRLYRSKARELVEAYWLAIQKLAEELERCGSLVGVQVDATLAPRISNT